MISQAPGSASQPQPRGNAAVTVGLQAPDASQQHATPPRTLGQRFREQSLQRLDYAQEEFGFEFKDTDQDPDSG